MAFTRKAVFVVGAKRTPFCKHGGYLRELPASYAFAAAAKNALNSAKIDSSLVDCTIIGNVNFLSQCDGGKTPRYCGIYSGVPIEKPALGVNKGCGSGLQAIITGALEITLGLARVCLAGGTDIMSSLPYLVRNVRFGCTLGTAYHFEDHIKNQLLDSYAGLTLHEIAENDAKNYNISRKAADQFAYNSYLKAASSKTLQDELASLTVPFKKKEIIVDKDDLDVDIDLSSFVDAPSITPDGTVVTSLNSARPADGAAALVLAGEAAAAGAGAPLARVAAHAPGGCDPRGGSPAAAAARSLLRATGVSADDVDLWEINETFASQVLATVRELRLDEAKVNVCGGALALGHPPAASGARLAVQLVHQLSRGKARRAIAASNCGAGQGIAVMFESV